ncbi:MAG: HDIG domain-containing metalloprotein [Kiritimatiellia bacterium]
MGGCAIACLLALFSREIGSTAPRVFALALVWLVAWPTRWAVGGERTFPVMFLEQLLILAPALACCLVFAILAQWPELQELLRGIFPGLCRQDALLLLLDTAPVTFSVLTAVLLLGRGTCALVGMLSGMTLSILSGFRLEPLAMAMAATVTYLSKGHKDGYRFRTRSRVRRVSFWTILALFVVTGILLQTHGSPSKELALAYLVADVASAVGGTFVALLLLPVFERMTRLCTDITLGALADLENPLLYRLSMECPGTYHHSVIVSHLARDAAEAIGANGLLARVIAYYHDIGKLQHPAYFAENNINQPSPHDALSPNQSRMYIVSHTIDGLVLGRDANLPQPVLEAIQQHHGTSVIRAFYEKAVQNSQQADPPDSPPINEAHFRYPGPKPSTRENAILMLSDITEAALRSKTNITPADVPATIDALVATVIADGQLDACPLTFREIAVIRRTLANTYTNFAHRRAAYPSPPEPKPSVP